MKTRYPNSYPYLNRNNIEFSQEYLSQICYKFLNIHKPKSLEIGWELALIVRWSMEVATSKLHFVKLVHHLTFRALRRGKRPDALGKRLDGVLELLIDPNSEIVEGKLLRKIDVERLVGDDDEVNRIAELRARDRNLVIEKLRKHWQGE